MSYTVGIPTSTQAINNTTNTIANNFTALNTSIGTDHVPLVTSTVGYHNKVTFAQQSGDPSAIGSNPQLYNKLVGATSTNELFIEPASGQGSVIQFTFLKKGAGNDVNGYWSFVPGGMMVAWNTVNNGTDNQLITFPNSGFPTACLSLIISPFRTTNNSLTNVSNVAAVTKTNFRFRTMSASVDGFFWYAIGN